MNRAWRGGLALLVAVLAPALVSAQSQQAPIVATPLLPPSVQYPPAAPAPGQPEVVQPAQQPPAPYQGAPGQPRSDQPFPANQQFPGSQPPGTEPLAGDLADAPRLERLRARQGLLLRAAAPMGRSAFEVPARSKSRGRTASALSRGDPCLPRYGGPGTRTACSAEDARRGSEIMKQVAQQRQHIGFAKPASHFQASTVPAPSRSQLLPAAS